MGLLLNKVFDPRDALDRTRWKDLRKYLERNPVEGINPYMPHKMIVKRLREKGIYRIEAPLDALGSPQSSPLAEPDANVHTVSADVLLEAQWEEPKGIDDQSKDIEEMSIQELRAECKSRGVPMSRTDKTADLRAKLNGQDAS